MSIIFFNNNIDWRNICLKTQIVKMKTVLVIHVLVIHAVVKLN